MVGCASGSRAVAGLPQGGGAAIFYNRLAAGPATGYLRLSPPVSGLHFRVQRGWCAGGDMPPARQWAGARSTKGVKSGRACCIPWAFCHARGGAPGASAAPARGGRVAFHTKLVVCLLCGFGRRFRGRFCRAKGGVVSRRAGWLVAFGAGAAAVGCEVAGQRAGGACWWRFAPGMPCAGVEPAICCDDSVSASRAAQGVSFAGIARPAAGSVPFNTHEGGR